MMDRLGDGRAWRLDRLEERIRALGDDLAVAIDRISELDAGDGVELAVERQHLARIAALEDAFKKLSSWVDQNAVRLGQMEARVNETRLSDITDRISALEKEDTAPPHDFTVTSTGEAKPMKRWALTSHNGQRALHCWGGVMWRNKEHPPTLFATKEGAALVRDLLFQKGDDVCLEEVEVVERDGRLVEARYVS